MLWTRRLTLVFGHTVFAASSVLAAFMLGLGAGSAAAGRWADSPKRRTPSELLRMYGNLELGIGLAALLSLPLLSLVQTLHQFLGRAGVEGWILQLAVVVLAFIVLLAPTMMMGATLPVVARALELWVPDGRLVGALYGVNTAGACVGAGVAGFLMVPYVGLTASLVLTALLNLTLGWAARFGARDQAALLPLREDLGLDCGRQPGVAWLPVAVCVSGACSMALQIGWTRGLILTFGSSTYAFSSILCIFLAGLGLGSLAYSLLRWRPRVAHLAWVQLATGLVAGLASLALGWLPYALLLLTPVFHGSFLGALGIQFALAAVILLGPALLLGLGFPLATDLYRRGGLGRRVATLYSLNTVGCVVGALSAGFLLLPARGAQATLTAASLGLLFSALALALAQSQQAGSRIGWLMLVCLAGFTLLALPSWNPALMNSGMAVYGAQYANARGTIQRMPKPTWYRDGVSSTVAVYMSPEGGLTMRVNGKTDASTIVSDLSTMYLVGYVSALYAKPKTAAVIGLGGGMTLEALAGVPGLERLDCAELEPAVSAAQPLWKAFNERVVDDPRVHLTSADGRTFMETSNRRYDIIVSEPSNLWVAGVGNLFTREFYQACRDRLSEHGVMTQWLQNYAVGSEELGMVINSFFDVFPHGAVWLSSVDESDLLLIGSNQPLKMDPEWVRQVVSTPAIRRRLFQLGLCEDYAILGHYVCSREAALEVFRGAPLNTDDRPALEFRAARQMLLSIVARVRGLSGLLFDCAKPLPEGIPATDPILGQAVQGWMACREPSEFLRITRTLEKHLARQPLAVALVKAFLKPPLETLEKDFQPALHDAALKPLAAYLVGNYLQAGGKSEHAVRYFEQAAEAPPPGGSVQLFDNLGSCYVRLDQLNKATLAFEKAVAAGGGFASLTLLGDTWLRRGDPGRALECYAKALAANQVYAPALWGKGLSWLRLQEYTKAAADLRELIRLVPTHQQGLLLLGQCLATLKENRAAIAVYKQLLHYYPGDSVAERQLFLLQHGQPIPGLQASPTAGP